MSSGSTYKNSFTIRYDNPTNSDRDTQLFELGSENPNRAIPFPVGAFLGDTGDSGSALETFEHIEYLPTTNQILTIGETVGADPTFKMYNVATGEFTNTIALPTGNVRKCKPVLVPSLPYQKTNGDTGTYEGVIIGYTAPSTVSTIYMLYPNPNNFNQIELQVIFSGGLDLGGGLASDEIPPFIYDVDLDILFFLGRTTSNTRIEKINLIRGSANIGIGLPLARTLTSTTFNWAGEGFPNTPSLSQFKVIKTKTLNVAQEVNGSYQVILLVTDPNGANTLGFGTASIDVPFFTGAPIFSTGTVRTITSNAFMTNEKLNDVIYMSNKEQLMFCYSGFNPAVPTEKRVTTLNTNILFGAVGRLRLECGTNLENAIHEFSMIYDAPRDNVLCIGMKYSPIVENKSFMVLNNIPDNDSFPLPTLILENEDVVLYRSGTTGGDEMAVDYFQSGYNFSFSADDSVLFILSESLSYLSTINCTTNSFNAFFFKETGVTNQPAPPQNYLTSNFGRNYETLPNGSLVLPTQINDTVKPSLYQFSATGSATANGVTIAETSNISYGELENSQIGSIMDVQSVRINIVSSTTNSEKQRQVLEPLVFGHRDINGNDIEYAKVPTIDPFQAQFVIPEMDTGSEGSKYMLDGNTRLKYNVKAQTKVDITFNYSKIKNLLQDTKLGLNELKERQKELDLYDKKVTENLDVQDVTIKVENDFLMPVKRRKRRFNNKFYKRNS